MQNKIGALLEELLRDPKNDYVPLFYELNAETSKELKQLLFNAFHENSIVKFSAPHFLYWLRLLTITHFWSDQSILQQIPFLERDFNAIADIYIDAFNFGGRPSQIFSTINQTLKKHLRPIDVESVFKKNFSENEFMNISVQIFKPYINKFLAILDKSRQKAIAVEALEFGTLDDLCQQGAFLRWESVVLLAIEFNFSDEKVIKLVNHRSINLVGKAEKESSVLYHLIKNNRWKLLWSLLEGNNIIEKDIECLNAIRRDINGTPIWTKLPINSNSIPKPVWQQNIFPHCSLLTRTNLSSVNKEFHIKSDDIRQLHAEFPDIYQERLLYEENQQLKQLPIEPFNALVRCNNIRNEAYNTNDLRKHVSLSKALGNRDLHSLQASLAKLSERDKIGWYALPSNKITLSLFARACAGNNVTILLFLLAEMSVDHELIDNEYLCNFRVYIAELCCQYGALDIVKFILLADSTGELFQLGSYLDYACKNRHTSTVKLVAPLASRETLEKCLIDTSKDPLAINVMKVLLLLHEPHPAILKSIYTNNQKLFYIHSPEADILRKIEKLLIEKLSLSGEILKPLADLKIHTGIQQIVNLLCLFKSSLNEKKSPKVELIISGIKRLVDENITQKKAEKGLLSWISSSRKDNASIALFEEIKALFNDEYDLKNFSHNNN